MTSRRKRLLYPALLFFALSLATASALLPARFSGWNREAVLLAVLAGACALPIGVAALRKRLDIFEPVYVFIASTFVYFMLIPTVLIRGNAFVLAGVDYRSYAWRTLLLALISLVGFYIGYYWSQSSSDTSLNPEDSGSLNPDTLRYVRRWAGLLLFFFSLLVVIWIAVARIPLNAMWIFGESSYGDDWNLATGPQIGYLYGAREALPACLLLLVAARTKRRWPLAIVFLMIALSLFFAGFGARFRVLLLVLSAVALFYLERRKRATWWQLALIGFMIFYFVVGSIGFYRGQTVVSGSLRGRSLGEDEFTVSQAWEALVEGSQIAVSTASVVAFVPEHIDYAWGSTLLNVFLQPIPRVLWPDKPTSAGVEFFAELWPPGTTIPFWSLFYLNFGTVGVLLGMAVWGWLSHKVYRLYQRHPGNQLYQVQLALYLPLMIHIYGRGGDNFAFIVYGAVYVMAPVWFTIWLVSRRKLSSQTRHPGKIPSLVLDEDGRPLAG